MIHPQQPPENDQRATGELDAAFLDETPSRVQDPHELHDTLIDRIDGAPDVADGILGMRDALFAVLSICDTLRATMDRPWASGIAGEIEQVIAGALGVTA
jgi:hypothetical protein